MNKPARHPYTQLPSSAEHTAWLQGWWEGAAVGCVLALALCVLLGLLR